VIDLEGMYFLSFLYFQRIIRRNKRMNKYFYIYNPLQANFFVINGLAVLEIGKGNQGNIYIKFLRNEKSEEVFSRWVERGKP
jgi:hypothetical protein